MIGNIGFKGTVDFNTNIQYRFQPLPKDVLSFSLCNSKLYLLKNICGKKK